MKDETLHTRPNPKRPRWGWRAWEATVGYIALHHHPDATLKLEVHLSEDESAYLWTASLVWGKNREIVENMPAMSIALEDLWHVVNQHHNIFKHEKDAIRAPIGYDVHEWFDERTQDVFDRLKRVTHMVFERDWRLVFIYRPVEQPNMRLQARMLAKKGAVLRSGMGASLLDVSRNLYHHCADIFANHRKKSD